jgi:predicted phage terminase large subunit-like protein
MDDWLREALDRVENMPKAAKDIRQLAENDLFFFARLVNPGYMYGSIHKELFRWLQDYNLYGMGGDISSNKLIMLPRAHLKSHIVATWAAWMVMRHPEITILYVSATAELAITQLYAIKNILDGNAFKKYWPEYINPEVGKREKWSATKIIIDHPKRKEQAIRDATITIAGLTTNTTGWHADVICADDLVVPENAYTEEGRESVSKKASQFTSIRNAGGFTIAAGTRYHPSDIYYVWRNQITELYDPQGEPAGKELVWDIKEYAVEEDGIFLWPRVVRDDNKMFGFNMSVLARIKAEYSDRTQFYAQYYNDPNDPDSNRIGREVFQYYNPKLLRKDGSVWYFNGNKLNVYAAVDFAYSLSKEADYTAIVVIGIDSDGNIYVLDIDRFKSFKTIEYFQHIVALHSKWNFRKINVEVTAAQKTISESIKDFVKKNGLRLTIEEFRPSREQGSKEQRIAAVLEHRYENGEVWHFEGGWTQILEDELILSRPPHDDIKDAMASAVSVAVPPARSAKSRVADFLLGPSPTTRFGGFR